MREVIVTGGTGALGRAVVERFVAEGARCHVTWVDQRELAGFVEHERVELHQVDCSDAGAVRALYRGVPALHAAIHLVGGFGMAPIEQTPPAEVERLWRLNAATAWLCCREAVQVMRTSGTAGHIVNVSARPALLPTGGMIAYSMAKAAVASLTQCLAEEVRSDGIRVNAIAPSLIDTPANRAAMPDADHAAWPKPEAIAETIAFLAGPRNALTSGALVPVYGAV